MAADGPERSLWVGRKVLKFDDDDVCATLHKIMELQSLEE